MRSRSLTRSRARMQNFATSILLMSIRVQAGATLQRLHNLGLQVFCHDVCHFTWPPDHQFSWHYWESHRWASPTHSDSKLYISFQLQLICQCDYLERTGSLTGKLNHHLEWPWVDLLGKLNHHLEQYSPSGHKSPGAGTAAFAPRIISCSPVSPWRGLIIIPWAHITMTASWSPNPAQICYSRKQEK